MALPPQQNHTPVNKVRLLLDFIFTALLGYYFFTDDQVALLLVLILMLMATVLFIWSNLKQKRIRNWAEKKEETSIKKNTGKRTIKPVLMGNPSKYLIEAHSKNLQVFKRWDIKYKLTD